MPRQVELPLTDEAIKSLHSGDSIWLNGTLYVARDAAHKKLIASLNQGQSLPLDLRGQVIYYMGPSPARPGRVIGAAGPTTSGRMDTYTPCLLAAGLKGMIGKGGRSQAVKNALIKYQAVYFGALGGAGALIAMCINKAETIAYSELGAEALLKIGVVDFPVVVINDIYGGDLYTEGQAKYRQTKQNLII
jgi:fumarate hydratase subunit beta